MNHQILPSLHHRPEVNALFLGLGTIPPLFNWFNSESLSIIYYLVILPPAIYSFYRFIKDRFDGSNK